MFRHPKMTSKWKKVLWHVVSQIRSVKEIRVKWLQDTLDNKWLMHLTHMQFKFKLHIIYTSYGLCYKCFWVSVHFWLFRGCLSSEYPKRDIFHSKGSSRGTSSVLCGHAPSCMNPVVLTLLTLGHVQKGRHGVWFPSPLTYDPTKDHSWDFVALYVKTYNSQACTVQMGKTDFFYIHSFFPQDKDRFWNFLTLFPDFCIHTSKETFFWCLWGYWKVTLWLKKITFVEEYFWRFGMQSNVQRDLCLCWKTIVFSQYFLFTATHVLMDSKNKSFTKRSWCLPPSLLKIKQESGRDREKVSKCSSSSPLQPAPPFSQIVDERGYTGWGTC